MKKNHFHRDKRYGLLLAFLLMIPLGIFSQTVTKTYTPPSSVSVDGCGNYCDIFPALDFTSADFPNGCEVTDVNVSITWAKTDGSCTSPGTGNSHHDELSFRLDGPTNNEILVSPGTYTGNATIAAVTTVFDQAAGSVVGGATPVTGTFRPAGGGNLNDFNGTSGIGTWVIRPGDNGTGDPLCISSYSITVTVASDNTAPSITCPGDQTGFANASCQFTLPDYTSLATVTDFCDGSPTVTQSPAAGTNLGVGTTVVTITATDAYSNSSNCTFNVVVSDTTPPTITCPGNQTGTVDALCQFSVPDYTSLATTSDNCDPSPTVTQSPAAGTIVAAGTTTITLTSTDASTNAANCTFDVVISETTAPNTICQDITVYLDGSGNATITGADIDNGSTDNCSIASLSASPSSFTCANIGTNTVTLTATDASGNSSTCTSTVTVADTTSPTAVCQDITVYLDGSGNATITAGDVDNGSTDNCTLSSLSISPSSFTCADVGTNTVTLTATDAFGNASTCTSTVTVADTTNPTASCQDVTVYLDGSGNASITAADIDNGSSDNCSVASLAASQTAFTCADAGANTVTLTVTDASGNASTCTSTVTVADTTNPIASCQDITVYLDGSGNASITAADIDNGSSDNCSVASLAASQTAFTCAETGANNVTLTVTDASGNTSTCTSTVTVADTISPTASCQNITVYLDGSGNASITAADIDNGSSDNCSVASLTASQTAFTCADAGANTVTLTVTDASGNTATCTSTVTIADTISPTASCQDITVYLDGSGNASITAADIDNGSSDNCSVASLAASQTAFTCAETGANTVTLTVTDASGNTSTCTSTVTVSDTTNPTASCQDIAVYLDGSGNASITAADIDNGSSDNCSVASLTASQTAFTCADAGANTVTLTVTDASGNTATCTSTVTIADTISPTASCQDITVYLDGSGNASITAADIDNGSSDNCSVASLAASQTAFTCAETGANTVTLTVTDASGNTSTCTSTVTVADTINPTASCQDITIYLDGSGNASITAADIDNGSSDNCSVASLAASQTAFTCADIGPNNVTLTVTDASGNTSTCISSVRVSDTTNPAAVCQDITVYLDGSGNASITAADIDNGSSDNCSVASLAASQTAFTCADAGANTVTLTVTDASGNTSTCTSTVTVSDTTNPTASCQDITVYLDGSGNASITAADIDNGSSDNCSVASLAASQTAFTCAETGTNTVTLTVTDASGNASTCTSTVTVADTTNPIASCQDITVYLDGSGNASITAADIDNGSSDNCSVASLAASQTAFTCAETGANTVTLTVTDASGNTSTCTSTVTVADTTNPTASCQDITVYLDGSGSASITAADIDNGSSDNCSVASLAASQTAFTCADAGANTVTLTVTDASGNTSTCASTVTVADTTNPTASCQDITVYLDGSGNASITAADIDNGSSDNCSVASLAASQTAFTCAETGTNTVTLTVTDASGNTATSTSTVTVMDTIAPMITCPGDQTETPDAACNFVLPDYTGLATATDNCSASPTMTQSPIAGTVINGTTTITLTAEDAEGNSSDCSFDVIINHGIVTAICQDDTVYLDGSGTASITVADIDGGSTIAGCGSLNLTASQTNFDCTDLATGIVPVELVVDNGFGGSDTCVANVTVLDTILPAMVTLNDVTIECGTSPSVPTTTDNCAGTISATTTAIFPPTIGTTVVTWTFDDGHGNSFSIDQNVIVEDGSSPIPSSSPLPTVTGACSVSLPTAPTANDACSGLITGTPSSTGPWTVAGTHVITWTYDDGNGNITTQPQTIVVTDTEAPVADVASLPDVNEDCSADPVAPTATDNCAGTITGVSDIALPITDGGTYVITWTFDDGNGNITTQTQNVTVTGINTFVTVYSGFVSANNTHADSYQWIDCSDMSVVSGETGQVFYPSSNGSYAVIITDNGCTDTSYCVSVGGVGIDDLDIETFNVYPNPTTNGNFKVDYEGVITAIEVIDMLGRKVELSVDVKTGMVDGTSLASGKYTVKVATEDRGILTRFISVIR